MDLMRIGAPGAERPIARIDDDSYVDVSDLGEDFDEAFFGGNGLDRIRSVVAERAAAGQTSRFARDRIAAPIARPQQILCVGLNYSDHAAKPDSEVELGIVIGRRTSYLTTLDEARDCIAGFLTVNDVSERAFQIERGGRWVKGKSAETFNPAGPWLVTPDEVEDVNNLDLTGLGAQRHHVLPPRSGPSTS